MEYFKNLPEEITIDILCRLPTETVLECKLVCTDWRSLVGHPSFSKMHSDHHLDNPHSADGKLGFLACTYLDDEFNYCTYSDERFHYYEYNESHKSSPIQRIRRVNLASPLRDFGYVYSCNGLICFAKNQSVYICNPITREYVWLPEIEIERDYSDILFGETWETSFAYVSSTKEYKVFTMYSPIRTAEIDIHIYTLGSGNGWRNLGKFNTFGSTEHIIANGAIYWLDRWLNMIVTFDLAEEKFREHLSLPCVPPANWLGPGVCSMYFIGVVDGLLFFAIRMDTEDTEKRRYFDIWLSKNKNGNHETKEGKDDQSLGWIKELTIYDNKLLAVTKSGGVLTYSEHHINIYDTKTSTWKDLVMFKNPVSQVFPHKNTLVSLRELGEKGIKKMEPIEIEEPRRHDYQSNQLQEEDYQNEYDDMYEGYEDYGDWEEEILSDLQSKRNKRKNFRIRKKGRLRVGYKHF